MRVDDDALLQSLHQGMVHTPLWQDFLCRLQARAGAAYASLVFRPAGEGSTIDLHSSPAPSDDLRTLLADHGARTSMLAPLPYAAMREGRVYALDELFDMTAREQRAFYHDRMLPLGVTAMRCIRVSGPEGVDVWLACTGGRAIGSATGALLHALAPHLRIAINTFAMLERERFRSAVTGEAFTRLNMGWLMLDAGCRIIEATENMEQMFQWGHLLRRGRYDRLVPASPAIDRQLTALVKRYVEQHDDRPQAFNLSRDPWVDMLVTPPQTIRFSGQRAAAAIVYVSGDRSSQADRCEQLVDLFGLLPSEARLAWMLAQATSIADAADALGLTIETARNYSKKIYAKTGARGQADLVRIILTSVLAIS